MAEIREIKASARSRVGKGAARAARREGRVPGVIYGEKQPPQTISVDAKEIGVLLHTGNFLATLFEIELDGDRTRVIPRDVQTDPVRDFPIHVDFLRLGRDAKVTVEVPVRFLNEDDSPGLKRGGVLNVVRYEIELNCPADSIPEAIEVDLTGLDINDSVHISAVTLPEGAVPTISDRDFTVATIAAPAGLAGEEEEDEEELDVEVERVGDEEAEAEPEGDDE